MVINKAMSQKQTPRRWGLGNPAEELPGTAGQHDLNDPKCRIKNAE
jgi:hypothetical protein